MRLVTQYQNPFYFPLLYQTYPFIKILCIFLKFVKYITNKNLSISMEIVRLITLSNSLYHFIKFFILILNFLILFILSKAFCFP